MKFFTSTWTARIFSIIVLLWLTNINYLKACGPDFSGYYFTYLFEQYNPQHKFYNYQLDLDNTYYSKGDYYDEEQPENTFDNRIYNATAWRNYLKLPATINDNAIIQFIYAQSKEKVTLKTTISDQDPPIEKIILGLKNPSLISYFKLLDEYEILMKAPEDAWNYDAYQRKNDSLVTLQFVKKCEKEFKSTKDVFIQWRLLYLMLRSTQFNGYYSEANDIYNTYYPICKKDESLAQYWCENIKSGACLRLGKQDSAIYYCARAFAHCPDQYTQAMNTYLFSKRDWKSALKLCKNTEDSIYVTLLEGANNPFPNMEFIQSVYQLNPSSDVLKLLWLRETGKIENYILNVTEKPYIFYKWNEEGSVDINIDSIYTKNNVYNSYMKLAGDFLQNPKTGCKATIGNSVAYIYYRKGDFNKAKEYLILTNEEIMDDAEKVQHNLLMNLCDLKIKNQFNTGAFIQLLESFKQYKEFAFNAHIKHYLLYNEIAPYYLQKNDIQTALWTYIYTNCAETSEFDLYNSDYSPECWNNVNYATYILNHMMDIAAIEKVKTNYTYQKGNNDFETYIIRQSKIANKEKMFDLIIARKYMLNQEWDKALNLWTVLPEEYKERLGLNPANFRINDTIEDSEAQLAKANFTIKQILELAQKLKVNADKPGVETAKDKLLYGTLLYNMSFYGKNHYVLDNHWNHYGSRLTAYYLYDSVNAYLHINNNDYNNQPMHKSYRNYFYLYDAEKYLQSALAGLSNMEDKATCEFLLAKCWQKRCPIIYQKNEYGYVDMVSDYVDYSLKNPYFKNYKNLYEKTKTYNSIYTACSYYRMFIAQK